MQVGIAGLGRMGAAIAGRLMECGHTLTVWNRSVEKALPLAAAGAMVAETPAEVARRADVILTILTDAEAIAAVYSGPDGLLAADVAGKLFIDMSTVRPEIETALAAKVRERGAAFVECPVGGTTGPARQGKLIGLMGAEPADAARAKPILDQLCRRLEHCGPVGAGALMKFAVNLPLMVSWQALGEALALVRPLGIAPARLVDLFGGFLRRHQCAQGARARDREDPRRRGCRSRHLRPRRLRQGPARDARRGAGARPRTAAGRDLDPLLRRGDRQRPRSRRRRRPVALLVATQELAHDRAWSVSIRSDPTHRLFVQPERGNLMTSVTLAQASTIVDAALEKGRATNCSPLTVAVLDAGGHLVAFKREDKSGILRFEIAFGKAWGSLGMGFGSREFVERTQKAPVFTGVLTVLSQGRLVPVPGGVLIRDAGGDVVGAVGISGDTSDRDEACAIAGIAAAGLKADTGGAKA